jgi:hypothetical protein
MTEYSFFSHGFKATLKLLLNGWAWCLNDATATIGGAGGFADRESCEMTARCNAESYRNAFDQAQKNRKEVTHD